MLYCVCVCFSSLSTKHMYRCNDLKEMSQDFGARTTLLSHFEITERLLIQTPLELVDGAKQ